MRPQLKRLIVAGVELIGIALLTRSVGLGCQEPTVTPSEPPQSSVGKCSTKLERAVLLHKEEPEYPSDLRQKKVKGVVILEGIIATDGTVGDIRVLKNPDEGLTAAAIAAFRRYLYKPARCEGRPVRVYVSLTSRFGVAK